jgi:hypothetical protein
MGSPVFVAIGKTDIASKPFFQKDLKVFPELKCLRKSWLSCTYGDKKKLSKAGRMPYAPTET